jgi:hypothetical protein
MQAGCPRYNFAVVIVFKSALQEFANVHMEVANTTLTRHTKTSWPVLAQLNRQRKLALKELSNLTYDEVAAIGVSDPYEYQTLTSPELLPGWSLNLAEFFASSQPASAQ